MKRGIEVELKVYENLLYGKVIYTPEELRGNLKFSCTSGYFIRSDNRKPAINNDIYVSELCLWGENKNRDNEVLWAFYPSKEKALRAKTQFEKTIQVFNKEYRKEQILDDIEKEYLEDVLRPLRCKEIWIEKVSYIDNTEYIAIYYRNIINQADNMVLPPFKKGTMYKNMEVAKRYTLEELGLFKEAQA